MLNSVLGKFISSIERVDTIEAALAVESSLVEKGFLSLPKGINQSEIIDLRNVLYVKQPKDKFAEITMRNNRLIIFPTHDERLVDYLENRYENFKILHKNLLVNLDNIVKYRSYFQQVFFSSDQSVHVTGAAIKNIVCKKLGKENDLDESANNSRRLASEYSPLR